MVASWMVELHLDQINRALLEESSEANSRSEAHTEALRSFLKDHVDILDVNVTISLLASYGRMDDLMHYATYRQVSFHLSQSLQGVVVAGRVHSQQTRDVLLFLIAGTGIVSDLHTRAGNSVSHIVGVSVPAPEDSTPAPSLCAG